MMKSCVVYMYLYLILSNLPFVESDVEHLFVTDTTTPTKRNMINYILLVSRQGELIHYGEDHLMTSIIQGRCDWQSGSQHYHPRQSQRLWRMLHNSSSLDGRECATSWNTKVRCWPLWDIVTRLTHSKDTKIVYRRYASLFFVCGVSPNDNELVTLEIIHRYVEVLDRYFGNVRDPFYGKDQSLYSARTFWRFANSICEGILDLLHM